MTRLKTEWIEYMLTGMEEYNKTLKHKTGMNLVELTSETYGFTTDFVEKARNEHIVAVVPVTQGEGIIGSFSESICAIVKSMGFKCFVSEKTDVDGIFHSKKDGADIIFMADDERYLGMNFKSGHIGENDYCTALGYIMCLRKMMKNRGVDISKEKLLLIGFGRVGKIAAEILLGHGCDFDFYDKCETKYDELSEMLLNYENESVGFLKTKDEIEDYKYILDFTNEGPWITKEDINKDALYASPGVPLSLDDEVKEMLGERAVYDNLEIGTALMLGETIKS